MEITLIDLSKALGCVDRELLRTTLFRTGAPTNTIQHIRHGHQITTLRCKDNGKYGAQVKNNVGVFQGSALSALLFIIYLGETMQDYQSTNDKQNLPQRDNMQIDLITHKNNLTNIIREKQP